MCTCEGCADWRRALGASRLCRCRPRPPKTSGRPSRRTPRTAGRCWPPSLAAVGLAWMCRASRCGSRATRSLHGNTQMLSPALHGKGQYAEVGGIAPSTFGAACGVLNPPGARRSRSAACPHTERWTSWGVPAIGLASDASLGGPPSRPPDDDPCPPRLGRGSGCAWALGTSAISSVTTTAAGSKLTGSTCAPSNKLGPTYVTFVNFFALNLAQVCDN